MWQDCRDVLEAFWYMAICAVLFSILIIPALLFRAWQDRGTPTSVFVMKDETKTVLLLIGLMLVGAALRLFHLDFQCAWTDEQFTIGVAKMGWTELVSFTLTNDCNPPLYYLLVKLSGLILGTGIVAARLVSVVAGVLVIPVMYWIGEEYSDELLGLLMAGFVATLYPFIYYSQFSRSYSVTILLFSCALLFFLRLIHNDKTQVNIAGYGLFAALVVYTHLYAIIPITLLTFWLLVKNPEYKKHVALLALALSPLLYLFYLVVFVRVNATSSFEGINWLGFIFYTPVEFFGSAFAVILTLIVYSLLISKNKQTIYLFFVAGLTTLSCILASFFVPSFPRYVIMTVPIFLLVAFDPISKKVRAKFKDYNRSLAVTVAILFGFAVIQYFTILGYYFVLAPYCPK